MRVLTFFSDDASAQVAWLSRIVVDKKFLPVTIHAGTKAEAIAKANAFWSSQVAAATKANRSPINHVKAKLSAHLEAAEPLDDIDEIC